MLNQLSHELGLSTKLQFVDVYSLTEPDLLAIVPRPVHALMFCYPTTPTLEAFYEHEQNTHLTYYHVKKDEATNGLTPYRSPDAYSQTAKANVWFPQTIEHACGLHGVLHSTLNAPTVEPYIQADSILSGLKRKAGPLSPSERISLLESHSAIEKAHASAAQEGDTTAPPLGEEPGHAFVSYVKASDGHLYEMEGRGKGPKDLGLLNDDEDVLSTKAIESGPLRWILKQQEVEAEKDESGDAAAWYRFSCTALVEAD